MRPDTSAHSAHDAGWPDEIDHALTGETSATDESVIARWMVLHPEAGQFFAVLQSELDPVPAVAFNAAAVFNRIVGIPSGAQEVSSAMPQTRATKADGVPMAEGHSFGAIIRAVFNGLAERTVAALFGKKDTELTIADVERLQKLVNQSESEDR